MKFCYLFFFIFFFTKVSAELKFTPILEDLNKPWSITSKSNSEHLITEKSGNIIFFNKKTNLIKKISHNLKVLEHGQGGLLDIVTERGYLAIERLIIIASPGLRNRGKKAVSLQYQDK